MLATLGALAPIFMTIALGHALHRFRAMGDEMWSTIEHLCFYVLFPCLLVRTLATADFGSLQLGGVALAMLLASILQCTSLIACKPLFARFFGLSDAGFTSVFQGATRWHGFIALAVVTALYGADGIAVVAVAIVTLVPMLNATAIAVLTKWGEQVGDVRPRLVRQILLNPLIIACVLGTVLNLTGIGLPEPVATTVNLLAGGALGISLLTVGAGLRPISGGEAAYGIVGFGVAFRLVLTPILMFACCTLVGVVGLERVVCVICAAVPTATNGYVLARKMGGDAPLMAGIITVQVFCAAVTLPIAIALVEAA